MFTQNGFNTFTDKITSVPKIVDSFKLLFGLCLAMAVIGSPLFLVGMPGPVALGVAYCAYIAYLMKGAFTSDAQKAYEAYDDTLQLLNVVQDETTELNAKLNEAYDAADANYNKAMEYKDQLAKAVQGNQYTADKMSKQSEIIKDLKVKLEAAPTKKDLQAAALIGWDDCETSKTLKRSIAAKRSSSSDTSALEDELNDLIQKYETLKAKLSK